MKSLFRSIALFLVGLTAQMTLGQFVVRTAPHRRETSRQSEGRRIQGTCGLQGINAGMGNETCGREDDGFARLGAVQSGCHLVGIGGEMDGRFAADFGGDLQFQTDRWRLQPAKPEFAFHFVFRKDCVPK